MYLKIKKQKNNNYLYLTCVLFTAGEAEEDPHLGAP